MSKVPVKGAEPELSADLTTPTLHLLIVPQQSLQCPEGIQHRAGVHRLGNMLSYDNICENVRPHLQRLMHWRRCCLQKKFHGGDPQCLPWSLDLKNFPKSADSSTIPSKEQIYLQPARKLLRLKPSLVLNAAYSLLQILFSFEKNI